MCIHIPDRSGIHIKEGLSSPSDPCGHTDVVSSKWRGLTQCVSSHAFVLATRLHVMIFQLAYKDIKSDIASGPYLPMLRRAVTFHSPSHSFLHWVCIIIISNCIGLN